MKRILLLVLMSSLFSSEIISQSTELYNGDSINRVNKNGDEVGKWILFSNNSNGERLKMSEGHYENGKKEGKWIDYYGNGKKKSIIEFKGGKPNGEISMYDENGMIRETGTWENARWRNEYKLYYATGAIRQEFFFNEKGKRAGRQVYYYPNGKIGIEGTFNDGKEDGKISRYTADGKLCSERVFKDGLSVDDGIIRKCPEFDKVADSLVILELAKIPIVLNDFQTLYNYKKQVSKEGIFMDNRLIDGKVYVYDASGKLLKIELYKNGIFAGFELNKAPTQEDNQRLKVFQEIKKNEAFFSENLKKREEELRMVKELLNKSNEELEMKENIITENAKEIKLKDVELSERLMQNQLLAKDKFIKELLIKKNEAEIARQQLKNNENRVEIESLNNAKKIKDILLESQKAKNKQNLELSLKQNELNEAELQQQKIIRNAFLFGFLFILIMMFFVYKNYREKKRANNELALKNQLIEEQKANVVAQKELIETKNHEITDSINYAQRIQKSILPPLSEVKATLPNSFILFKPKDIVSGDFYWFFETDKKILIGAGDCTGHGVPGAFMSTIGSEKLNEAVLQNDDVAVILQTVNKRMKKVMHQTDKEDSTRDGMDIALCAFNKEMTKVEYAGANRPIWVVRKDNSEIEVTKATKVAIGGFTDDEQVFAKHSIGLQKGDTVYIFSDGYADQFSPQDKKLMTRKFKEIILSIQNKSMEEQKEFLGNFIEDWRGDMEQTDDILVIGVKI